MSNKGIGSIKDYTPNFNFIIPKFDIATWHDYIESNFRSIDALFYNLFDIQNFSGEWTQLTKYTANQVLFIGEDLTEDGTNSEYAGRMVTVLVDHTTDNSEYFNIYYKQHPDYYELFADASTAQKFAQQAQQSATNALQSEQKAKQSETNAKSSENVAIQKANEAATSANTAQQIVTDFNINAENKTNAFNSNVIQKTEEFNTNATEKINIVNIKAQEAQTSANNALNSEQNAAQFAQNAENSAASVDGFNLVHKTGDETIYGYKTFRNDNSMARMIIQGYLGLSENPAISGGQAYIEFHDKNGEWEGVVGVERYTSGKRILKIQLRDQDSINNRIELIRNENGVWYATCPTPPTTNNDKAIATTAWVHSFFNLVYPVGSLYFSTAGTCPLQSLGIGTWNKVGTSLTLNVDTNVPVKGNGQALGLIGEGNVVKYLYSGGVYPGVDREGLLIPSNIGGAAGARSGSESGYRGGTLIGISTNSSNSGVVGTVTRTQITVNVFQRTA